MSANPKAPMIKGWCPGAHKPMLSGDGLIMRVRPWLGQLSNAQTQGLCAISQRFGNGVIDLTNRANLQLRGISNTDHQAVLDQLLALDLLDSSPALEQKRNIICAPIRANDGPSLTLARILQERLTELPDLPAKFGFALDADGDPQLRQAPADIRIEQGDQGLLLCADGAEMGLPVRSNDAIDHLLDLANWFAKTRQEGTRRMGKHLTQHSLPARFAQTPRRRGAAPELQPQQYGQYRVFGAAFGKLPAEKLATLMQAHAQADLVLTPFRMFALSAKINAPHSGFIDDPHDPALPTDVCTGAPGCSAAAQNTQAIARSLLPHLKGKSLHVSGCAKGCARARAADVVLVGQNSGFDLVFNGCSWDEPVKRNLNLDSIIDALGKL